MPSYKSNSFWSPITLLYKDRIAAKDSAPIVLSKIVPTSFISLCKSSSPVASPICFKRVLSCVRNANVPVRLPLLSNRLTPIFSNALECLCSRTSAVASALVALPPLSPTFPKCAIIADVSCNVSPTNCALGPRYFIDSAKLLIVIVLLLTA